MFLLNKFIAFTSTTLKRFIFTATLIVSAITFSAVLAVVCWIFIQASKDTTLRESTAVAEQIQTSMARALEQGGDSCHIGAKLDEYRTLFPRLAICLKVTPEGAIPDKVRSATVIEAIKTGKPSRLLGLQHFDHAYPIRAEGKCLRCHADEGKNQIMAVLVVREDVSKSRSEMINRALIAFFLLLPIPVLMAFLVSRFVNRHLGGAVMKLSNKVHLVTCRGPW